MTCDSSTASCSIRYSRRSGSIEDDTSSRTTSPKRRRRARPRPRASRSSASSETVKSASRVTRKQSWLRISMPGKSRRGGARSRLERDEVSSPIGTKRGSTSFGTFTRAKVSCRDRVAQPHREAQRQVRDVREGRPGPTASGVSAGKIWSWKWRSTSRDSSWLQSSQSTIRMPCSRGPGRSAPARCASGGRRARARARDPLERLARGEPVGRRGVDAGVDLVVEAGHAHHEELVEVRRVDREELHALEQRHALVLGQLEHAFVELSHESSRFVNSSGDSSDGASDAAVTASMASRLSCCSP